MKFNYDKLRRKMKSERYNITTLANDIGMTRVHLSSILNNHACFRQEEIANIISVLNIKSAEVKEYFFSR